MWLAPMESTFPGKTGHLQPTLPVAGPWQGRGQGRRDLESTEWLFASPFLPEGAAGIQMALGIAIATAPS